MATEVYVKGFSEAQYRNSIKKDKEINEKIIVDAYTESMETISQFKADEIYIKSVLMTDEDKDCYRRYKRIEGKQKLTKTEDIDLREERSQIYEKIKYMFKKLTKLIVPKDDAEIKVPIQDLLIQEQALHKATEIRLTKAVKMISIKKGENKVLGKQIIRLKNKIVQQKRIIQNYEYEKSDTEDEKSDAEDEKSDTEDEKSDAEDEKSDAEDEKGDAEVEKGDAEDEKGDAEDEKGDAEDEKGDAEVEKSDAEDEKSDSEDEKSDVIDEKSDVIDEKSDTEDEKSDVIDEKSDAEVEKSDAEVEKGDVVVEKSDAEVEKGDVVVEKSDAEVEIIVKGNQRGLKRKSCQIDNSVGLSSVIQEPTFESSLNIQEATFESSPDIQETVEGKKFSKIF